MSCIVKTCKNYKTKKVEGISFYNFPKSVDMRTVWTDILSIDSEAIDLSKKLICSIHFTDKDIIFQKFKNERKGRSILRPGAVPSLFLDKNELDKPSADAGPSCSFEITKSSNVRRIQQFTKRKLCHTPSRKLESSGTSTSTDSSKKRRRVNQQIKMFLSYSVSPKTLKSKYLELQRRYRLLQTKLYGANKKVKRLHRNVTSLNVVLDHLKKEQYYSNDQCEHIEKSYENVPSILMSRYLKNVRNQTVTHENYPPPLRKFAAMLQFYSPKAYEHVRSEFALALPHQSTIRKWTSNINCEPGYIDPAFDALKLKVEEAALNGHQVLCSLLLDEMSIKKQVEFDGERTWGYVDIGVSLDNDTVEPATEALVLVVMVVAHQSHWKLPIAYFLIKSLNGIEKANIVRECLSPLFDVNVKITSLTCDGPSVNFSMIKELGCEFHDVDNLKTWFNHPCDENQRVYCLMDACHMLKLARNNTASLRCFKDPEGNIMNWKYIEDLHNLQEEENLYIANKLMSAHMNWYKQKMKVNLAAQTLSGSVATALEFLHRDCQIPKFHGCNATVHFIRTIDRLFDILNSKSPFMKESKAPMKLENEDYWRPFLKACIEYLLRCTDLNDRPLYLTPKKTPFIGFAISAISVMGIFDDFVRTGILKYLLTYKCSQDHLEIFFCSIRSRNGWNNNPSSLQFMRTFRRLLLHSKISGRGGNCRIIDSTPILTVPSTDKSEKSMLPHESTFDISFCRKYNLDPSTQCLQDHDYDVLPNFIGLSDVSSNIVVYISGYVVKMMKKILHCVECLNALTSDMKSVEEEFHYSLVHRRNKGGLQIASAEVILICKKTEISIRNLLTANNEKLPKEKDFFKKFVLAISQMFLGDAYNIFPDLKDHEEDGSPFSEKHIFFLIKEIIRAYTKIRLYNLGKRYTSIMQGPTIRNELTKRILFSHQ